MNIALQLTEIAEGYAQRAQQRVPELEHQIAEIEAKLVQARTEREAASRAAQRLADYPVKIGVEYFCPRCWIDHGRRAALSPIPSDTNNDLLRCHVCHLDIEIEAR